MQPLLWRARQVRSLFWPLFSWSAWVQQATVCAGTTGEGVAVACVRSVDVVSASQFGGGTIVSALFWPLYSRTAWAHPATAVAGKRAETLLWPLFAWSAWAQIATVVAGPSDETLL
jgi:hypothetical protein